MADRIVLRGMTWDHARGYDPMVATSAAYAEAHPDVEIVWEKRSLQAFADRPIGEMSGTYDLMVIDHPHVGEVARAGHLLALDVPGREAELEDMARHSVGASHPSYQFEGRQWGLAIDAATPVACHRPDLLDAAPERVEEVMRLAEAGRVAFALIPINSLMCFFGLARNRGHAVAEDPERLMDRAEARETLADLKALADRVNRRCFTLDPIGIYDWMSGEADAPAYSPWGYGYTNYSRPGYASHPLRFADAPGVGDNGPRGTVIGGTGVAVSAQTRYPEVALDYAYWIAGAECQKGLFFDAGGQPAHAAAWEDNRCNASCDDFFRRTRRTLETSWLRPRYDGYMRLQDRGGDIVQAHLKGEAEAGPTLDALDVCYRESLG